MCMEDIRIGRRTKVQLNGALAANGGSRVVPDEPLRTQLTFYPAPSGAYSIGLSDGAAGNNIINIDPTSPALVMTVETHGQLVIKAWDVTFTAATTVAWSEGILMDR